MGLSIGLPGSRSKSRACLARMVGRSSSSGQGTQTTLMEWRDGELVDTPVEPASRFSSAVRSAVVELPAEQVQREVVEGAVVLLHLVEEVGDDLGAHRTGFPSSGILIGRAVPL